MRSCLLVGLWIAISLATARAAVDRNGNGMSDVWEMIYGASALAPGGDTDGDGFSNLDESRAGTNPFDSNSYPRLRLVLASDVQLWWDSLPGKRYTIESQGALDGVWTNEIALVGAGGAMQTNLSLTSGSKFFRLGVADADSDADGVSDYEERALGFDPNMTRTDRYDQTDLQRITNGLAAANTITISALDPLMFERWPDPGLVAIRRSGGLGPVSVNFAVSGTAIPGMDYLLSATNSILIPAGIREVWIELTPISDSDDAEPTETVTLTLQPGLGYSMGTSNVANLTLANETATSPPNVKAAARFLLQAAYGPDLAPANGLPPNLAAVSALGFAGWIHDQFTRPIGYLQPWVDWAATNASAIQLYGNWKEHSWWSRALGYPKLRPDSPTTQLPDPLRQRVAFALSEILVASDRPEQLAVEQQGMANFYDLMIQHAFGNYRDLLYDVALHPVMGVYLSHLGNVKHIPGSNIFPDENFAREIMQLFTIGLWELNPDGTRILGTNGQPIATYDNSDITELARVFTGFDYGSSYNYRIPMQCSDALHDCDPKILLGGLQLPARIPSPGTTGTAGLADVNAAVSNLFAHPNVGPFLAIRLIQRFVTSNPSTGYVARVAAAFANNGSGTRGDLKAVVKAILLDPEARDPAMMSQPAWGKLREPVLRVVNFANAFNAASTSGYYPLDQFTLDHGQDPMNSPSVFNFFLPTHSPPGPITQQGYVAPEFQILNASTAITGPNYFWDDAILTGLHTQGAGNASYNVRANITNELAMIVPAALINDNVPNVAAFDPDALIRRLDLGLTGGTLSPPQFQIIREAMERVNSPTWEWHQERLRLAIYLMVTSPDFNVLR